MAINFGTQAPAMFGQPAGLTPTQTPVAPAAAAGLGQPAAPASTRAMPQDTAAASQGMATPMGGTEAKLLETLKNSPNETKIKMLENLFQRAPQETIAALEKAGIKPEQLQSKEDGPKVMDALVAKAPKELLGALGTMAQTQAPAAGPVKA